MVLEHWEYCGVIGEYASVKQNMKKTSAKKQPDQGLTAQILVDIKPDTPSYYVNFIGVSHSPYEFTLSAIKIPSPFTPDQLELVKEGQGVPIEPLVQLVLPPLLVDGLIKALIDQKQQFEQTLAKQVKNNELQHQHIKSLGSIH